MFRVLVTPLEEFGKYSNAFEELRNGGCEVVASPVPSPLSEDQLIEQLVDIDAIIAGNDFLTARVINSTKRLRVVSRYGSGLNTVDLDAAREHGIRVTVAPNAHGVADLAFGLILSLARRICSANTMVKSGEMAPT